MTDRPGYRITKRRWEALAEFRRTLPPEDSPLRICPPGCTSDHDAERPSEPFKRPRMEPT
jgi:hypothetical protein